MPAYFSTERLYLDAAGKVVKEDDPSKVSLLVGAGGMIPEERARELGLIEEKAKAEPAANKQKAAPAANKSKA